MHLLYIFLLFLGLNSCTNEFAYKQNDWELIIQTDRGDYQEVYLDKNRIDCAEGKCNAWVKFIFSKTRVVPYSGNKFGENSGQMMIRRMDSSVQYDCARKTATIISYQLYDGKNQMIDSKWIKFEPEFVSKGSIHEGIMNKLCNGA